jgi:hypothetical protein
MGGGVIASGSVANAARSADPPFSRYTYAATATDDGRLRVAWYETYRGSLREHHGGDGNVSPADVLDPETDPGYVTGVSGPVVSLSGVVPGDEGVVVVGLEVVDVARPDPMDVYVRAVVTGDHENGVNGPEAAVGDDPADPTGELGSAVEVVLWRDDVPGGSCDGQYQPVAGFGETVVADGAMASAFDDATTIGTVGERAFECLAPGSPRCLSLSWRLPIETGNDVQTDGVDFDVAFGGVPCGAESPFQPEVSA